MIDRSSVLPPRPPPLPGSPEPPNSPAARGPAAQFCWTIFFALILAVGLYFIRHGRLPGLDQPLFAAANPRASAPDSGSTPSAPYAPQTAPPTSAPPANPSFNPSSFPTAKPEWRQQTCANLILEAPMMLTPTGLPRPVPGAMSPQMEFSSVWKGGGDSERLAVVIWSFRINGEHTLSIEDGERGSQAYMRSIGAVVDNQGFRPQPIWVSGCTARRVTATKQSSSGPMHFDSLCIQRRREAMIIVIGYGDDREKDAMRILNSVQVQGGPNG